MSIKDSIKKLIATTNHPVTEEELDAFIKSMSEDPKPENDWDDMLSMLEDARKHANANGRKIITQDNPVQLRIGYACTETGRSWSIRIANAKRSLEIKEDDADDIKLGKAAIKNCLISTGGRDRMVQFINSNLSYEAFGLLK